MFTIEFALYDWLLAVLQSQKKNFKISQFSRFLLRYKILVKIWKRLKLFNSLPIHQERMCKWCLQSNLIILTDFHSLTVKEDELKKLSIFKISAEVCICDLGQNLKMTETS